MFACSREFAAGIQKAIMGEAEAIIFYRQLLQMTREKQDREIISQILRDEEEHYRNFSNLYQSITTGRQELRPPKNEQLKNYEEGLFAGVIDETEDADFYSELIVATTDQTIRDLLFGIVIDELRHASLLNLLFAKAHHR
ncbi:MAG: hypothetical protein GX766_05640 [Firmicutes bacterium]|jgi:rubrerythrin|nr:hypothetical protein [Bacillota bacterium]HOB21971.1 ferritin family protein [Bacillota bacterium]HQD39041.1 ferritin family protein [Bacillota bacterium]